MKIVTHFFVLSCLKATMLIEKSNVLPLSFTQKVQLKLHTTICDKCNTYQKQSQLIDSILKKHLHTIQKNEQFKLSDAVKSNINNQIQKKIKK